VRLVLWEPLSPPKPPIPWEQRRPHRERQCGFGADSSAAAGTIDSAMHRLGGVGVSHNGGRRTCSHRGVPRPDGRRRRRHTNHILYLHASFYSDGFLRLSRFSHRNRKKWSLPEPQEDEEVLVLTDANGRTLACQAPTNRCVASYLGGKLLDVVRLLERGSVPPHVQSLVVAMGINDRFDQHPPIINTITRIRELVSKLRCWVMMLPFFDGQPHGDYSDTTRINDIMAEVFIHADHMFEPLPDTLLMQPFRADDYSHYSHESAYKFVNFIRAHLASN